MTASYTAAAFLIQHDRLELKSNKIILITNLVYLLTRQTVYFNFPKHDELSSNHNKHLSDY